jgi:hypothetical protein
MHWMQDVDTIPMMYAWSGAVKPANWTAADPFRIASPLTVQNGVVGVVFELDVASTVVIRALPTTMASKKCSRRIPKERVTLPRITPAWYCTLNPADGTANPSGWLDRGIGSCGAFASALLSHNAVASSVPVRAAVGPAPGFPTARTAVMLVVVCTEITVPWSICATPTTDNGGSGSETVAVQLFTDWEAARERDAVAEYDEVLVTCNVLECVAVTVTVGRDCVTTGEQVELVGNERVAVGETAVLLIDMDGVDDAEKVGVGVDDIEGATDGERVRNDTLADFERDGSEETKDNTLAAHGERLSYRLRPLSTVSTIAVYGEVKAGTAKGSKAKPDVVGPQHVVLWASPHLAVPDPLPAQPYNVVRLWLTATEPEQPETAIAAAILKRDCADVDEATATTDDPFDTAITPPKDDATLQVEVASEPTATPITAVAV